MLERTESYLLSIEFPTVSREKTFTYLFLAKASVALDRTAKLNMDLRIEMNLFLSHMQGCLSLKEKSVKVLIVRV